MDIIGFAFLALVIYVAILVVSIGIFLIPSIFVWEIFESCFNGNVYQIYYESDQTIFRLENQIKKLDRVYDDEGFDAVNKIMIKETRQKLEDYKREENRKLCCAGDKNALEFLTLLSPVVVGMVTFFMNWNNREYVFEVWLFVLPATFMSAWIFMVCCGRPISDFLDFLFRKIKMRCTNRAS